MMASAGAATRRWDDGAVTGEDAKIAAAIRALAAARGASTFCPSEVARRLADAWRPLMPRIRAVAASMPDIAATQSGVPVDAAAAQGPIRLVLRGGG